MNNKRKSTIFFFNNSISDFSKISKSNFGIERDSQENKNNKNNENIKSIEF
jgi:hypothetical protein